MPEKLKKMPVNRYMDIALLVFLIIFPLLVKEFRVEMMCRYLCYVIFALSLDLLWGYTGLLSLGHAVLFGMGGYMIGMCYQIQSGLPSFMTREGITELPWFYIPLKNPIVASIIGILLPALFAWLLGNFIFSSKLREYFLQLLHLLWRRFLKILLLIFKNIRMDLMGYRELRGLLLDHMSN